jgi:selenocysteine-specific elongation factor
MNNVIIGTAGHVDHGKTSLIRALTGIETHRLQQEKERGITIELGFAWFDLPDGRRAGIIDVPGHERFVRNMLAGAAGIDVVLLVVAADEGVMPQTREHLNILELLGVKTGIVVITKADLVEEELLELAREEIHEALSGTFLAAAPRVPISVVTSLGLEELRETISRLAVSAPARPRRDFARLPVDRVFIQKGFGTVVTGTLVDGSIREGDQVLVMPGELRARVRQIQNHGRQVESAEPGQRVAINLAGLERQQIQRGQVVFRGEGLEAVDKVAARFKLLPEAEPLVNNTRIRFHCGASETLGRAIILEGDVLEPGQDALVQFRLDVPVMAVRGDHYVVRSESPVTTIGGGEVIESSRRRLSRVRPGVVEVLKLRESGGPASLLLSHLQEAGHPLTVQQLLPRTQLAPQELSAALEQLQGMIVRFTLDNQEWILGGGDDLLAEIRELVEEFHRLNPLRPGMPREEVRGKVLPGINTRVFAALLEVLLPQSALVLRGQELALAEHRVELDEKQSQLQQQILTALAQNPFSPPELGELEAFGRGATAVLKLLAGQEKIVIAGNLVYSAEAVAQAVAQVREHFGQESQLTLAQFRDYLGTSRKYALPLIEYLDGKGFTRRRGEVRLPGPSLRG